MQRRVFKSGELSQQNVLHFTLSYVSHPIKSEGIKLDKCHQCSNIKI